MRLVTGGHRQSQRVTRAGLRHGALPAMLAVAGLVLATGCSSTPGGSSSNLTTVTVAAYPGVEDAPLFLGIQRGLFRDEGLHVVVKSMADASSEIAGLEKGTTDVAFSDYPDMFYASEQTADGNLRVAADGYDCGQNVVEVLTYPGSGITSPQQLGGQTVAIAAGQGMPGSNTSGQLVPFSLESLIAWSALQSNNVHPAPPGPRPVHWQQVSSTALVGLLGSSAGEYKAIVATEPDIYTAEQLLGAVPVLDVCTGATADLPLDGYFTTSSFANANSQVLSEFRSALASAQAAATASPSSVDNVLQNVANFDPLSAALLTLGTYPTSTSVADLQRVATLMNNFRMLPHSLSVGSLTVG